MITAEYIKKTFQFSPNSNIPFYSQLASYIKHQIQAGVFQPGDKMITENELCEILNVSRTTVRLSMKRIVDDELLVRYRGKGSFIAERKIRRNINYMYNFTENIRDSIRDSGATPSSIVLENAVLTADADIDSKLQLPEGNKKIFRLKRIRCADNIPILVETTHIPYYLCNGIESTDFETAALYHVLGNQFSLNLYHAAESIEAVIIEKEAAQYLQCQRKMAGFKIERISYLDSGYIFEYTTSVTRADKCAFRLDLYRNNTTNKNSVDFERRYNP